MPHWTDAYIGLPYDEANCGELCARVAREVFGRDVPPVPVPQEGRGRAMVLLGQVFADFVEPADKPAEGDVVVLRHGLGGRHWHVGTLAFTSGQPWVLHATSRFGAAILTRVADLPRFYLHLDGYYRWK